MVSDNRDVSIYSKPSNSLPVLALAMLLGGCLLQLQPVLQWVIWCEAEMLMLLPITLLLLVFSKLPRMLLMFFIGYLWALLYAQIYLSQQLPESLVGQDLVIQGVISDVPEYTEKSTRFNFNIERVVDQTEGFSVDPKVSSVRLSWYYHQQALQPGERWQLTVRLKPPHGMQNPGGFDYEKWLLNQGIHATGYVRKDQSNHRLEAASASIDRLRQSIMQRIRSLSDTEYQGLLLALTIGYKSQIEPQQWQRLIDTGTSHLMAISGLHIGLVATLVFFLVRHLSPARLPFTLTAQQLAALVSLFVAGFYALLAGFSIPTQRAFVMLLVMLGAILLKRPAFSLNTLSLALIVVLIINPFSVLQAGFWLSFLAVLIIGILTGGRPKVNGQGRIARLSKGLRLQWMIALGMLPLTMVLFQQASVISPLANLVAIPLIGFVQVPLVLLASLLNLFTHEASVVLFQVASWLMSVIWWSLEWLSNTPHASVYLPASSPVASVLALIGGTILLLPAGLPGRYIGVLLLLPVLFVKLERPLSGEFWMSVLDVGQGLSILIRTRDHALLYDAGDRFSERFDIGERVIVPFLRYQGIKQLDAMMISHKDRDHSGGASAILRHIPVKQLLGYRDENMQMLSGQTHRHCRKGDSWNWDGVRFEVLHPDREYSKSNNRSCVLKISSGDSSVILPGDIASSVERQLVKAYGTRLKSQVLVLAHHGSSTSSSSQWLQQLTPALVIASAGYKNRFGHPAESVRKRLEMHEIPMLNTASAGAIQIKISPDMGNQLLQVNRQRKDVVHYWNHRF